METIKKITLVAVALTMGLASCSNVDDGKENGNLPNGERTSMQFVINLPKAPATYAPVDGNAIQDEIDLITVDVLIYEQTAIGFILEQKAVHLLPPNFTRVEESDTYKLNEANKIATTTGVKKIFVAMNYGGTYPAVGSPISAVAQLQATLTDANDLSNTTTGFAMFSTEETDASLVTEDHASYSSANNVKVKVKRLVAKISVQESNGLSTGGVIESQGGWLTNLQFAVGNINKSAYLLQNVVGTAPDRVVQDANWSTFASVDFFGVGTYRAVDNASATIREGINPEYATENTANTIDPNGENLTYVSVRAKYVPAFFCNATGTSKGGNNLSTTPVSFWTVICNNGELYYFDVEDDATTFQNANVGSVKSAKYEDGYCYWRGYLNQDGAADVTIAGSKAAKFDVLRNVYYKTLIKSIKAPGEASDKGKVTEATSLIMEVEVQPWETHTDEWDL